MNSVSAAQGRQASWLPVRQGQNRKLRLPARSRFAICGTEKSRSHPGVESSNRFRESWIESKPIVQPSKDEAHRYSRFVPKHGRRPEVNGLALH